MLMRNIPFPNNSIRKVSLFVTLVMSPSSHRPERLSTLNLTEIALTYQESTISTKEPDPSIKLLHPGPFAIPPISSLLRLDTITAPFCLRLLYV